MVLRLIVTIVLMLWASDKEKALGPAMVFAFFTLGFGVLTQGFTPSMWMQVAFDFALAFGLFWLVGRTGGAVGLLVRTATVLILGGVATFLWQTFGK